MSVTAAAIAACARCATPLEHGDLRCAVCALPAPHLAAPVEAARVRILRCTECGAAIGFDPNHQAPACAFCRAVMVVEQPVDPPEIAEVRLPFAVDRERASVAVRDWLGRRGYFAPRALQGEAVLESLTPLYWASWVVSATATVAWTADSDHGAERSRWAPHAGQVPLTFDRVVVSATRGLSAAECRRLIPHYDLAHTVPALGADEPIESFDTQRSAARAQVADAIADRARVGVQDAIPGHRYRNIHVACLVERQTTERVALPAWVLAYRYRGRPYRAIVHGQRGIVFGRSPVDWTKVARLAVLASAIAAVIALAVYFWS